MQIRSVPVLKKATAEYNVAQQIRARPGRQIGMWGALFHS